MRVTNLRREFVVPRQLTHSCRRRSLHYPNGMETSNEAQDAVPGTTSTVVDENSTSEFVLPSDAPDTLATHQQQHDLLTIDEPWKFAASSTTFEDATYLEEVDPSHVQDSLLSNHQVETVDSYDFLDSWSFNIPNIDDDTQSLAAPAVVNLNQGNMEDSYCKSPQSTPTCA